MQTSTLDEMKKEILTILSPYPSLASESGSHADSLRHWFTIRHVPSGARFKVHAANVADFHSRYFKSLFKDFLSQCALPYAGSLR